MEPVFIPVMFLIRKRLNRVFKFTPTHFVPLNLYFTQLLSLSNIQIFLLKWKKCISKLWHLKPFLNTLPCTFQSEGLKTGPSRWACTHVEASEQSTISLHPYNGLKLKWISSVSFKNFVLWGNCGTTRSYKHNTGRPQCLSPSTPCRCHPAWQ